MHSVLESLDAESVEENLPHELLKRHNLIPRRQAISEIHFPPENMPLSDYEMFRSSAHRRLIFEEFFWLSFSLQLLRGERRKEPKGTVIEIPDETLKTIDRTADLRLEIFRRKCVGEQPILA